MAEEEIGKISLKTRIALILAVLLGLAGVVVCALGLSGVWDVTLTNKITPPLIGTSLLISGVFTRSQRRAATIACCVLAVVCYVVFVLELVL
jgi:uncharacterized membrane protein HdeD (DUF308 family)